MNDEIFAGQDVSDAEREELDERIVDLDDDKLKFYEKLRKKARDWTNEKTGKAGNKLAEYLFLLPDFFILVSRVALDKRVPTKRKLMLGGIVAYVMLPLDIIPDFIPILGSVDDLVLVVMGLNMLLNEVDQKVLEDNWSGEGDVLHLMQKITATAEKFLDQKVLARIKKWLKIK
ncbi:MAG: DUF1232 domain-containing protein [Candidatus Cloacimonetes bacterium]|jgi:uncharacterized membrane protein YkvA (DUF1232 family)|nr:DUF1232 domain-containing protein [Candidatus Cloacimonadota bacterium]MDD3143753.1 DUF1232 domain-containing protein [Candidatus Cloacimonadota bacterium]MDY0366096.1 DUF1232 domain-containing protein [Candidatus Syntrophosphaera sp.]HOY85025.1 DUF1232 domain-containing protein [Candidatus Syntrophosphaera sp.]HPH60736.1 DUF1232 domain-containing protein [Candidatus Syntrophosphaera sp.]